MHLPPHFPSGVRLSDIATAKRVTKKWGYELWLLHEDAPFACKIIHLNAGARTSLQYHEKKEEMAYVLSGEGLFQCRSLDQRDLQVVTLNPGYQFHVKPLMVHRVHAVTDLTYLEVSTLELDDVVRLEDDWNRPNGHLAEEHR